MPFNPIKFAEKLKEDIAIDYIGKKPKIFKNLINKLVSSGGDDYQEKLDEFIRFKGPYIQALPIPKWGNQKWIDFASEMDLNPNLSRVFSDLGIEKLFCFQEKAIKAIQAGIRELLIVASTGRGKTEAWLIPILNDIIGIKNGDIPGKKKSVKAILIYPTKALSQDQFKRIINILIKLNPQLPSEKRITIGIYDGDTPYDGDKTAEKYLFNAFRYFKCPIINEEQEKCINCGQRLKNKKGFKHQEGKERYYITVPEKSCEHKCNLDFIYLTRDDIIDNKVDILLTNPDTINYKLFNINANIERQVFILEPKYIVIDEIHIYKGIFGAFTSLLLKRYKTMRNYYFGEDDDLRIIAASATVQNKIELFSKISGSFNPTVIEEEYKKFEFKILKINEKIPDMLLNNDFTDELTLVNHFFNKNIVSFSEHLENKTEFKDKSEEEKIEILQNYLYDYFLDGLSDPINNIYFKLIQLFYYTFEAGAKTIEEGKSIIKKNIKEDLSDKQLELLFYNLYFIGCFSGIIENRVHLFSWPLDGYYGCINCGRIFSSKEDQCPICKESFITSIVLCSYCGEQFFESWFCPECFRLSPANVNNEGISSYYEERKCNGGNTHEEGVECFKIIWKPTFKCNHCGKIIERVNLPRCNKKECEYNILEFIPNSNSYLCDICNDIYSINEITETFNKCPSCDSKNISIMNNVQGEGLQCSRCGDTEQIIAKQTHCQCGGVITPYRRIPWVCLNPNCGEKYFDENPPKICKKENCNSRSFALNGLFDITSQYECKKCEKSNKKYIKSIGCGNSEHQDSINHIKPAYKNYKVIYHDLTIRKIERKNSIAFFYNQCYHPRKSQIRERRFDGLYFTPLHTAVTASAFLLRYFIDSKGKSDIYNALKNSKLLSFSDSISEMEEIGDKFREPEYELFIDKIVFEQLSLNSEIKLKDLQENVFNDICSYFKKLFSLERNEKIQDKVINEFQNILRIGKNQVLERIFKDVYNRFIKIKSPRNFVHEGIGNFIIEDFSTLSDLEQKLIKEILNSYRTPWLELLADVKKEKKEKEKLEKKLIENEDNNQQIRAQINELEIIIGEKNEKIQEILENLKKKKYIKEKFHKFYIDPERIFCFKVDKDHPILFEPFTNQFHSNYSNSKTLTIKFITPAEKRKDINKDRFFSRNIYRILTFPKIFLISRIYRGGTSPVQRRLIEFNFKTTPEINFLSTGPAMEIGIDIGELNMLLLYGTPPNINSYLQRIGRAGRKAKKSLILSVSKRNPIDYFYFNNTLDLIQSESKPVPVNVLNPEVNEISLTWAILDYLSINYNIFWENSNNEANIIIYNGFEAKEDINIFSNKNYKRFTNLLYAKINTLITGFKQIQAFDIIKQIISRDHEEIKTYLERIVDFNFCNKCNRVYSRNSSIQECSEENCGGKVINAIDYFNEENLFIKLIDKFSKRMLFYFLSFNTNLRKKIRELEREKASIEDQIDDFPEREIDLFKQYQEVEQKHTTLVNLKKSILTMKFIDFMKKSIMKKYFFNLRNIDDDIEIYHLNANRDGSLNRILADTRNLSLALKDYHPYAKVKNQARDYFVVSIEEDDLKREQLNELILDKLNNRLFCSNCNQIIPADDANKCSICGSNLQRLYNLIPKSVDIIFHGASLNFEESDTTKIFTNDLFPLTNRRNPRILVQKTYCVDSRFIYYFKPEKCIVFKKENSDDILIELKLGKLGICFYTEHFNASYSNGIFDRKDRFFRICGHEGCNSILDFKHNFECPKNKSHTEKKIIRLIRDFHSRGIEINIKEATDIRLAHTLCHGLKLALQEIAGVDIRSISESEGRENTPNIYLFDTILGGNGICETLFYLIDGKYKNLEGAIETIKKSFGDCCISGCPHCIYQYGCYKHNNPEFFNKSQLLKILKTPYKLEDISYDN